VVQCACNVPWQLHDPNSFYNVDCSNVATLNHLFVHCRACLFSQPGQPFSFCSHPWIYDPASKARILQLENQIQQLQAFEKSMMSVSLKKSAAC